MSDIRGTSAGSGRQWSRRDLLRLGAQSVTAAGLGALVTGCSSSPTTQASTNTTVSRPRSGGVLALASTGGSSTDTLDGQSAVNPIDWPRVLALYNTLLTMDNSGQAVPALADEVSANKDATVWTIRLKSGLTCHDGSPFTAEDVLFSFKRILNPKAPLPGATMLAPLDTASARILDPITLRVPCTRPYAILPEALFNDYCLMVPAGFDPKRPVGTGPFKYKSFNPGVESTFVRFPNYWEDGQPYADSLVVTDFADETSQVNALLSGEANLINLLTAASVSGLGSEGMQVVISRSGGFGPITMRVDTPPFNDVRVRQAFKFLVDRPQMIKELFDGYGLVGNDIFSIYDPSYDHALPQRHQDLDQARSLLRAAGHENLHVTLTTSSGLGYATLPQATVFAQQASAGGVSVFVNSLPTGEYFSHYYLQSSLSNDYWPYSPYLLQVAQENIPAAPFNETHWSDTHYTQLYQDALATLDFTQRTDIIHEMQRIDYDSGGLIVPYFVPVIDGLGKDVRGVVQGISGYPLNNYDWGAIWIDS